MKNYLLNSSFSALPKIGLLVALMAVTLVFQVACGNQLETGATGLSEDKEILGTSKSTEARNHFSAGNKLLEGGKWEAAIDRYTEAIKQDGSFGQAYENRALAYMRFNRFDKSLEDFAEALEIGPESSRLYFNLGNLYASHAMFEPAVKAYRRSDALEPGQIGVLNNLGNALSSLKKHSEAIEVFRGQIRNFRDRPEGYNNLGVVFEKMGELTKAEAQYNKAMEIAPAHPDAYFNMGVLKKRAKNPRGALSFLKLYLEKSPQARDRSKVENWILRLKGELGEL